jgi:hypothetical protein
VAVSFQQTDTASACSLTGSGPFCSTNSEGISKDRQATVGGLAGSTAQSVTILASQIDFDYVSFECLVPDGYVGSAGSWVVRMNVTTANSNLTWDGLTLCRVNSSCVSQQTVLATTNGLGILLSTTGVKSTTQTGSAVSLSSGDRIIAILAISNGVASSQAFSFTPNQLIDSPFSVTVPPMDAGRRWQYYATPIRM